MALLTTLGLLTSAAGAVKGFMSGSRTAAEGRRDLSKLEYQDLSIGAFDNVKPSLMVEQMQMNMIIVQDGVKQIIKPLQGIV